VKPGKVLCPMCRHWDGHADDCPERNANTPSLLEQTEGAARTDRESPTKRVKHHEL
jgi:hypothetical protein